MTKREPITKDGVKYRRVTEIIDALGFNKRALMGWANYLGRNGLYHEAESKAAAAIGTYMHACIEREFRDQPQPHVDESDPFIGTDIREGLKCFRAWRESWAKGREFGPIAVEERLFDEHVRVSGSPDLIAWEGDAVWIYDWKTSSGDEPKPEHWIQQGAYAMLAEHALPHVNVTGSCVVVVNKKTGAVTEHRKTVAELTPWRELFWCALAVVDAANGCSLKVAQ